MSQPFLGFLQSDILTGINLTSSRASPSVHQYLPPSRPILPLSGPEKLASRNTRSKSPLAVYDRNIGYSPQIYKKRQAQSGRQPFSALHLLSAFVVLIGLVIQFWHTSPFPPLHPKNTPQNLFGDNVRRQEAYFDHLEPGTQCRPKSLFSPELPYSQAPTNMALAEEAKRMAAEFDYSADEVRKGVKEFIKQMGEGLEKQGSTMSQIPSYVTAVPNGTEKGVYLAVDLGGTNFRVCSIVLHGNQSFSLTQSKVPVPHALMEAKTAHELFAFLAKQIEIFLKTHHNEHFEAHSRRQSRQRYFDLGFTFSFPVNQLGINKGKLIRWTKGFDIDEAVGQDVCALLQKEIDALDLPVAVAALVNDTVGTLMARSYTSPGKTGALIGAIFGTGTNGAYVEKLDRVKKMAEIDTESGSAAYDRSTGLMIINTEWGSFDNGLAVLPSTPYDQALDAESVNPGIQMFEKRVSGMFLGEILRRTILALYNHEDPSVAFLRDSTSAENDTSSTTTVADDSPLYKQWGIDTSFLSIVEADASDHLRITKQSLEKEFGVSAPSTEDCAAVKTLVHAIGKRAARLAAVALGAVVISTNKLQEDDMVDIGVDGSLVEFYPGFEDYIREAFRELPEIGVEGDKRIRIGLAKDGSGLGAALIALVASKAGEKGEEEISSGQ